MRVMMIALLFWLSILFVFYVYLGYPLILALLARLRPRQLEHAPYLPKVTLLIAAYNEQDVIASKLENALTLNYPKENLQIIVAADGSDDRTAEIVKQFEPQGVELSYQPERRGKMAAINQAMSKVRHEIIVFSDANNLYGKETLRELIKPFSRSNIGAVSGSKQILNGPDALSKTDGLYWRYESYIKEQETRLGSCAGVSGEILAIRSSLYQTPPDQVINDDFFIALGILRQGYRLVYAPKARSFEHSSLTEKDEATRRSRIVAGRYQVMLRSLHLLPWRNPLVVWEILSHKFMRPFVPFAMIMAFILNLFALTSSKGGSHPGILYLGWPYNLIMFSLQIVFYLSAWLGNRLKGRGPIGKILYVPTFLVNSNFSALRGLFSFLTGRQTPLWQRARRRNVVELE
jgi:poly-beta-1,6-N-acetyl-D-glucosamine synthase